MGVPYLEGYLKSIHQAAKKVEILKLIENYRKEHKKKPIIIVDNSSVMRHLYKEKQFSWLTGGQMKEFETYVKEFILAFKNAELVFFFEGPQMNAKISIIHQRRKRKLKDIHNLFNNIKKGTSFKEVEKEDFFYFPDNIGFIIKNVAKQHGCKVINASEECDIEIVRYALKNRCMAVISQDTDYVIFRSAQYYWSAKYLKLDEMTTINYDREGLASHLGISSEKLPLLASLLGNDIVPRDKLMEFHKDISSQRNPKFRIIISNIAKFIRSIPIENYEIDSASLKDLALTVFGDETEYTLLQESIRSYNPEAVNQSNPDPSSTDDNWGEIIKKIQNLHREDYISSVIFDIVTRKTYSCGVSLEDCREKDLPPSERILRSLRKKLYGILLYEHPGECNVKEWIVSGFLHNKPKFMLVGVLKPKVNHPGLLSLWSGQSKEHQWNLIGDICDVDASTLKSLPHTLIIPALSINWLCRYVKLHNDEIRSLVASTVLVKENIELTHQEFSTRPLRLYALLTKTFAFMIEVFNGVGNPIQLEEISPSNYQNGDLFYEKYIQAKNKHFSDARLCENNASSIQKYKQLMAFVKMKNQSS